MLVISQAMGLPLFLWAAPAVIFPEQRAVLSRALRYSEELSVKVSALHLLAGKHSTRWV